MNFADARARLRDPDAVDVGYCGHNEDEYAPDDHGEEVGAVTEDMRCYRCQGMGTWQATAPPRPRRRGRAKVSKVTARERTGTTRAKARLGGSRHQSAPTVGSGDIIGAVWG